MAMAMASSKFNGKKPFFITLLLLMTSFLGFCFQESRAAAAAGAGTVTVPAIYVFGDSLVDVGNNNHIHSLLKADYPHNGIDYPTHKPTGRFSNGFNAADFLAEKVGLPTAPPYLANVRDLFLKGVSFASGGAGIFNTTNDGHLSRAIPLTRQVELFEKVSQRLVSQMAPNDAQHHLSKSLFIVVIGSNDLFGYFNSDSNSSIRRQSPQAYVNDMVSHLQLLLKWLHRLGARKFVVVGVGAIGCCPSQRLETQNEECNKDTNLWASKYNEQLKASLAQLRSMLDDINYTYFDTYGALSNLINQPSTYGFTEVKAACCGLGKLRAKLPCTPISQYCANRTDHIFWDFYHPSEAAARILVGYIFTGSQQYATPVNLNQLIAL